jgi:uncharacterized membrane protein
MIEHLRAAIDGLNNPSIRHAALVHFPIVLASLCTMLALATAILHKNITLRVVAIVAGGLFIGACFIAVNSGEDAEHALKGIRAADVDQTLHDHEEMAKVLWMFAAAMAGLLFISAIPKPVVRHTAAWLAVFAGALAIGWVTITAHLGGTLVYTHGIGTQAAIVAPTTIPSGNSAVPTVPATHATDGEAKSDGAADVRIAFFREQVQPILSENCFSCHNPRRVAAGKSGKLDQTSLANMLKGGRSGPAIVPGKPEESLLVHRIRGDDPDEEIMPPDGRLPQASIDVLMQWVADGAVWDEPGAESGS